MLMWNIWGRKEIAYSVSVGKPEGRLLGRSRGRKEDNIKCTLKEAEKMHMLG
jgi:hypothetical protein